MAVCMTSVSTSGVPEREKVTFWANQLCALFGQVNVDAMGERTLDGEMDHFSLSTLGLSHIRGTRSRIVVTHPAVAAYPHSCIRILYQNEGLSIFEQDDQKIEFGPGDCLIYDFSRPHLVTNVEQVTIDSLCIPKHLVSRRGWRLHGMKARKIEHQATTAAAHDYLKTLIKIGPELQRGSEEDFAQALLNLTLLPFADVGKIAAISQTDTLRIRAKQLIDHHLADPELTVETLAKMLGCTPRYLHLAFEREGISVSRYLWKRRIEACRKAIEAPESGSASLTRLAFAFGFSSSAHFSRMFRFHFGFPPSDIRKQISSNGQHPMSASPCKAPLSRNIGTIRTAGGT